MSAIIHKFKIQLTPEQAAAIRKEWLPHAGNERAMLAIQPIAMTAPDGIIDSREPHLNCAIFDSELSEEFDRVIIKHKKARPASKH
jgi:hypothetical protein